MIRYNRNLLPQPHYFKFKLNDVRHLMLLRDGHPNRYPARADFRAFRESFIRDNGPISDKRAKSGFIFTKFIEDNQSDFDQIFQSAQFLKGLSVSLFSVYRKRDSLVKVAKSNIDVNVHDEWNAGRSGIMPQKLMFVPENQSTGIRCADISKIKLEHHYQPTQADIPGCKLTVGLQFAHKPTYCNFWHCEMTMYIEDSLGNKYVGQNEMIDFLKTNFKEKDNKAEKIIKKMAKDIRKELYRFLVYNPKGRKKYLPKYRYSKRNRPCTD